MTRFLLLIFFIATMGSRALGLDFGLAPGLSVKNALLYAAAIAIAADSALAHNRKLELLPVIAPFATLILYALITWAIIVLVVDNPYYSARSGFFRLKDKLGDQFLVMLVFFYGVVNWRDALWLLKALTWVTIAGCLITVVDSFDMPDLGIITTREDGRVEGIIGSSQQFGGLLAFVLPIAIALWRCQTGSARRLALAGVGLVLVCILLSGSRGAMAGILVGAVIAAALLREHISAQAALRVSLWMVLFVAASFMLLLSTDFGEVARTRLSTGLESGEVHDVSSGRTAIWLRALSEMADQPWSLITGFGWEVYHQQGDYRLSTHNVYLDRLYNLGIVGLALFVLVFVNAIARVRRGLRTASESAAPFLIASAIGMVSFMVAMAFSDIHLAGLYVWAYMGLALRIAVSGDAQAASPPIPQAVRRPPSRLRT